MSQATLCRLLSGFLVVLMATEKVIFAQPAGKVRAEKSGSSRKPNDNLEGAIWQFRATRKDKENSESILEGKMLIEEKGVFEATKHVDIPGKNRPGLRAEKGDKDGKSLSIPDRKGKRIGDVTKTNDGKSKLILETKEFPLEGIVILWPKKDRPGVWMGTYQERKNNKNGDKWIIELREVED